MRLQYHQERSWYHWGSFDTEHAVASCSASGWAITAMHVYNSAEVEGPTLGIGRGLWPNCKSCGWLLSYAIMIRRRRGGQTHPGDSWHVTDPDLCTCMCARIHVHIHAVLMQEWPYLSTFSSLCIVSTSESPLLTYCCVSYCTVNWQETNCICVVRMTCAHDLPRQTMWPHQGFCWHNIIRLTCTGTVMLISYILQPAALSLPPFHTLQWRSSLCIPLCTL